MNKPPFNKNLRARFYQNTTMPHNLNLEAIFETITNTRLWR